MSSHKRYQTTALQQQCPFLVILARCFLRLKYFFERGANLASPSLLTEPCPVSYTGCNRQNKDNVGMRQLNKEASRHEVVRTIRSGIPPSESTGNTDETISPRIERG